MSCVATGDPGISRESRDTQDPPELSPIHTPSQTQCPEYKVSRDTRDPPELSPHTYLYLVFRTLCL